MLEKELRGKRINISQLYLHFNYLEDEKFSAMLITSWYH